MMIISLVFGCKITVTATKPVSVTGYGYVQIMKRR